MTNTSRSLSSRKTIRQFKGQYRFLSNFYPFPVVYPGRGAFRTAEGAFQAAKTDDPNIWSNFLSMDGKTAKKSGRALDLPDEWEFIKESEMRQILIFKFMRGSRMADLLLDTGEAKLIEGNTWGDAYWGYDLKKKRGLNRLGELLMERREVLQ